MIAVQVARIIAVFVVFCSVTDDELLDPDESCEIMEYLGHLLLLLDKPFLRELIDAFSIVASEYTGESHDIVRNIPLDFYLEEELAADDPVRLAELEAIRDATPL
ncbi:hypothetical protein H5J25_17660 [Sphingomonas aliaeris]|uniref:Uncharacterized protein n=1 Tax=Sphingomonas aliaeris TaxID=2759526 RepID=A0A974NUF9_9SPHN|nr:hypothetical protein [Sphingomonas aliaeris]QQV77136.1 hypothetical protein H5J25_17660 [Sphingomonas aliaeris]